VVIVNTALCEVLGMSMDDLEGQDVFSLDSLEGKTSDLRSKLEAALDNNQDFETRPFKLDTSQGEETYSIQGSIVGQEQGKRPYRILLHFKKG
jgi:PAS domain S-box-containing protein